MNKIDEKLQVYQELNFLNLIDYDVELSKEIAIKNHEDKIHLTSSYNIAIDSNDGIFKDLYEKFILSFKKNFGIQSVGIPKDDYYTMVNNEDYCPINWHNHKATSQWVGVYYLNVPNDMKGGDISFREEDYEISIRPIENSLIVFPNWLLHSTNYIDGKGYRISINMEVVYK